MFNMDATFSTVVGAILALLLSLIYYYIKNRKILPGPKGVPYLGLYPFLTDENVASKLEEYKNTYGDIFSFTYTGRLYINLGSVKAMREVLLNKSDCFSEKYKDTNILTEMLRNGVTFLNGEPWKVLRKFFIIKFKEYGLNTVTDNMAGPVYSTLNTALDDLRSLGEKPVNIANFLDQRCAVSMCRVLFGEKDISDEIVQKMIDAYLGSLDGNFGVNLLLIGPLARLLFAIKSNFKNNLECQRNLAQLVLECSQKIENSLDEEHPTCVIEEFYIERNKRRRENDLTWKYFSDEALAESVLQFVGDGIKGVSSFIYGVLNALVEYPDEQDKLHAEIMEVIGPNRQPAAEDRQNLPYVTAFLNEYLRKYTFMNFFPSVECTRETTIRGYQIPVGSIALLNFYSAHNDPDTFDDPETFNPSRYMPSEGKSKAELPVIFGIGKRSCSGEAFVMLQTFLFVVTIVKNFKIVNSNAPNSNFSDLLISGQIELTFIPRSENGLLIDT